MRRIMAIYDEDPFYAMRLSEVINRKERIPFEVMAFSSMERLKAYGREKVIELLLVSSQVAPEALKELEIKKTIFLWDGETAKREEQCPSVYKYQSSDSIIREVMACYCDEAEDATGTQTKAGASIIGIYSPIGRCLKTSLALTIGQLMAQESRTLYITLEEYSGLPILTGEDYREDLSDLMYCYSRGNHNVLRLNSVIHSMGGLDYIPPARYPEDLSHMEAQQMAELIRWVAGEGGIDVIILDVGSYGRCVFPLLEICRKIFMPVKEDPVSKAKEEEFFSYMERSGYGELEQKIKKLSLPSGSIRNNGGGYPEQLLWSELGDYARELLKGGTRA